MTRPEPAPAMAIRGGTISVFGQRDEFCAAVRAAANLTVLYTEQGRFRARMTQVALRKIRLIAVEESAPRIGYLRVSADELLVCLSTQSGSGATWGGIDVDGDNLVAIGSNQGTHVRTRGSYAWGAIWLPDETYRRYSVALTGETLVRQALACYRNLPAYEYSQLRELHAAAIRAVHLHSEPISSAEAAHGLEQQLIHAVIECLAAGALDAGSPSAIRTRAIALNYEALLETNPAQPGGTKHAASLLGVAARVLQESCTTQLGMSPSRYSGVHRLHAAHRTLRDNARDAENLSTVARRFGFRDADHFTNAYFRLFGHLPSATLRGGYADELADLRWSGEPGTA